MWGSATLTTVMSRTSMNCIRARTPSAFQRRGSGRFASAAVTDGSRVVMSLLLFDGIAQP